MHFLEAEHLGFVHTQCFYFYPPLIMSLRSTLVLLCQKLQPRKLWLCVCVGKAVCVQCYYSYLTKFTLSSKSAGWHNICIYICVCVCVCVCLCVCVCAHSLVCFTVDYLTSSPPLRWSYCLHYHQHTSHCCCLPTHWGIYRTKDRYTQRHGIEGQLRFADHITLWIVRQQWVRVLSN